MKLLAYPQNDKQMYLDRVRRHIKEDTMIFGNGWNGHSGCSIGCTLHSYEHSQYPTLLGTPEEIAYLQDAIYEGIGQTDKKEAWRFTEQIIETIQPGADLSMVWPRFALELLSASDSPLYKALQQNPVKNAADVVASLFRDWVTTGKKPKRYLWAAARADAGVRSWTVDAAAWDVMDAALDAGIAEAAAVATWSARAAAWTALTAMDAGDARADAAADAAWLWMRDLLLRLISESPILASEKELSQ